MNCLTCQSPLLPGSRRRYCSDACRMVAFRQRRLRTRKAAFSALSTGLSAVRPLELRRDLYERLKALVLVL